MWRAPWSRRAVRWVMACAATLGGGGAGHRGGAGRAARRRPACSPLRGGGRTGLGWRGVGRGSAHCLSAAGVRRVDAAPCLLASPRRRGLPPPVVHGWGFQLAERSHDARGDARLWRGMGAPQRRARRTAPGGRTRVCSWRSGGGAGRRPQFIRSRRPAPFHHGHRRAGRFRHRLEARRPRRIPGGAGARRTRTRRPVAARRARPVRCELLMRGRALRGAATR